MRTITLIGPVLPFRGGIAQHTTMLHRTLRGLVDLQTISFVRQYPKWLFPGESDRDPAYAGHEESGVRYLIDSLNPLTWKTAVDACVQHKSSAVVLPWWTIYWLPCFLYLTWTLRRRGVRVIFFCHNVVEHETAKWKRHLTRMLLRQGSAFMVHTREDETNLSQLVPDARITVHSHPIYEQFPPAKGILPRRAKLELLFYGFVRHYKGLDILIEAMGLLRGKDVFLTVVGEFWDGREDIERRIRNLDIGSQIELVPRYVSDEETAEYFQRADLVVLPYRNATGSGVIPLAYHYGKPVIATRVGGLPDVVIERRTGFLIPPESSEALARQIEEVSVEMLNPMAMEIDLFKGRLTWEGFCEDLLQVADVSSTSVKLTADGL